MTTGRHQERTPNGLVIVDYQYDELADTFTVEFSGSLLRELDWIGWTTLGQMLQSMAQSKGSEPQNAV